MDALLVNQYPGIMPDTRLQQLHKTDRNPSEESEYQRLLSEAKAGMGGGAGGIGTIPPFTFDYDQAEKEAFEKLRPYYEQKLAEAQGDVNLAKSRIEEDYQRGRRYRQEDLAQQLPEEQRSSEEERARVAESLNQRGLLFGQIPLGEQTARAPYSEFAQKFYLNPQQERANARKLAIERSIGRQEEVSGIERARGLEDINIQFPRQKREMEEEKRRRAITEFVPLARERARARYEESVQPTINQYLQQA